MNTRKKILIGIIVLVLVLGVAWFVTKPHGSNNSQANPPASTATKGKGQPSSTTTVDRGSKFTTQKVPNNVKAVDLLNKIPVGADDTSTKYDRVGLFGTWQSVPSDPTCDTMEEAYKRDMTNIVFDPKKKCEVTSATLAHDPYTGETIQYKRGNGSDVDIDHIVPLGDACYHGMCQAPVTQADRLSYANDPYVLTTVNSKSNRQKGDKTIDEWEATFSKKDSKGNAITPGILPEYKCSYVAHVIGIKYKYKMTMLPGEHDRISQILNTCSDQLVPNDPESWGTK